MMMNIHQVLYTAQTHTSGGRTGAGKSSDGALDVALSPPGSGKPGTNPEQLFGVGYSACFIGALNRAGASLGIKVPAETTVDASVSLGKVEDGVAFALGVKLSVTLPGLEDVQKRQLVDAAHLICPYSNATRGNIAIEFETH